jgi:hypothetical protein
MTQTRHSRHHPASEPYHRIHELALSSARDELINHGRFNSI